jgi:gliding motility-associated-like protein
VKFFNEKKERILFCLCILNAGIWSLSAQQELSLFEPSKKVKLEIANEAHIPDSLIDYFFSYLKPIYESDGKNFIQQQSKGVVSKSEVPDYVMKFKKKYVACYADFLKNRDNYTKYYSTARRQEQLPSAGSARTSLSKKQPITLNAACNNVGFELGSFTGWTGSFCPPSNVLQGPPVVSFCQTTGQIDLFPFPVVSPADPSMDGGIEQGPPNNQNVFGKSAVVGHQTLMTPGAGDDLFLSSLFGISLPRVWPGGTYSVRLGNDSAHNSSESMSYSFVVTPVNELYVYHYAAVLYDGGHPKKIEPYFHVQIFNQSNEEIETCASFSADASEADASDAGLTNITTFNAFGEFFSYWYNNWNTITVPLMDYLGKTVTVTFTTADCAYDSTISTANCNPANQPWMYIGGNHFAYAYISAECAGFNLTYTSPNCSNSSGILSAPVGFINYTWTGPGIVGSPNQQNIPVNQDGNYHVDMTIIGESSCTISLDTVINSNFLKPLSVTLSSIPARCASLTDGQASVSSLSGGMPDYSYSWSNGDSTASLTGLAAATYTLTVSDGEGCTISERVTVTQPANLTIAAIQDSTSDCGKNDGIASVSANGGLGNYTYSWSTGSSQVIANDLIPGTYTVSVSDGNNCSSSSEVIIQMSMPTVSVKSTQNVCPGKSDGMITTTSGGTGYTYTWSNGSSGSTVSGLSADTYSVTVADVNGCTAATSAEIEQFQNPTPSVDPGEIILSGQKIQLLAAGGITYLWSPSESLSDASTNNPVANPARTTVYTVVVTDQNNCTAMDSVEIVVLDIFIPSAFSPNGDGQNDVLFVRLNDTPPVFSVLIYDRWGELVFETSDPAVGWDGTFRGKMEDTGVFTYLLEITAFDGKKIIKKGNVSLIR